MNFIRNKDFPSTLNNIDFKSIEFIAFLYSSWHLDVFYSWVQQKKFKCGAIFLLPQSDITNDSKYRLNESNFIIDLGENTNVYFIKKSKLSISITNIIKTLFSSTNKNNNQVIYLINPGGINAYHLTSLPLHNFKVKYLSIDEGTSTYLPANKKGLLIRNTSKKRKLVLKSILIFLKSAFVFFYKIITSIKLETYYLFLRQKSKLTVSPYVASSLKQYYISNYKLPLNNVDLNSLLILKDFDSEILANSFILEMYKELFDILSLGKYKVYIKKHPNDQNEEFNILVNRYDFISIINTQYSAEAIIPMIKPFLVLGGISTSLFTIPSIFEIRTISFMNVYKKYKQLNPLYKDRIDIFNKLFNGISEYFYIISEWQSIKKELQL